MPRGLNASIIRLRLFTKNSGVSLNSFAYKITNKNSF